MSSKSAKAAHFDTLLRPIVTEKSTLGSEHNQVTFEVRIDATKPQIKAAVEGVFGVKVKAVNTLRQQGFESVYGLKGGMAAWSQAGLPVVTGKKTKSKSKSAKAKKQH